MKHAPNMMDTSLEELSGLIERLESRRLDEDDYAVVANVVATVMYLKQVHDDKSMSIKRLLNLLFGSVSSEKTDKLLAQLEAAQILREGGRGLSRAVPVRYRNLARCV